MNNYIKQNVERNEFELATIANKLLNINTPKIINYNRKNRIMEIVKIDNCCIADYYGDDNQDTPTYIYEEIRKIIKKLLEYDIIYPDITGYNFIQDKKGKIWIIDFGHAYIKAPNEKIEPFILSFINGFNGWNPNFK